MATLVRIEHKSGHGLFSGFDRKLAENKPLYHLAERIGATHNVMWHGDPFDETRYAFNSKRVFKKVLRQALTTEKELTDLGLVVKYLRVEKEHKKRLDSKQCVFDYQRAVLLDMKGDA